MGDALQLPFPDSAFACATAGFSLRNMADVPAAIEEMARVVSPGGRVTTLELTPMPPGIRATLGRLYFHRFVPLMGQLVAGDRTAYTYLPSSVDYFLTADGLADVYRQAGLVNVGLSPARVRQRWRCTTGRSRQSGNGYVSAGRLRK